MVKVISVSGQKKVSTLMDEFSKSFPYLGLRIYRAEAKDALLDLSSYRVDRESTLAAARSESAAGGTISVSGNKKIRTLEREFDEEFGLYVQVCYCPKGCTHEGFITSGSDDDCTLAAFNEKCEKEGCSLYAYDK